LGGKKTLLYQVSCYIICIFLLFFFSAIPAAASGTIFEVQVNNLSRQELIDLIHMGVDVDGFRDGSARIYISPEQFKELENLGYSLKIIPKPKQSRSAGYHTLFELESELKAVEASYPEICRLQSIGKTYQDRDIWVMKISDNADIEEDEPEVTYISAIHGDEPVGMELSMNLIQYLVKSYGTNSRITSLINEIEIRIMPLMNPDAYAMQSRYNSTGKDLNRDFPDRVSDPVNTPEGRAIETQHVMNWVFKHSPVLSASFHAGAQVVNYPFDSDPDYRAEYSACPDDELFIQQALTYASLNPSISGSSLGSKGIINGVEWYPVYGAMQDWLYIWQGCNQLTIEISDEKWPPYSEISSIWENNRESMLSYMEWSLKGIRGMVTDNKTGKPVFANIRIKGIDHDVYTDPDVGDYHRMLLPDNYTIDISADGYVSQTISDIIVNSEKVCLIDISLCPVSQGDINGDCEISLKDAILCLQAVSMTEISSSINIYADVNNDMKIGIEEAVYILNLLSK